MKTNLPQAITTVQEAMLLLTELHNNGEAYHPEDDATDIDIFSEEEGEQLNKLMVDIYNLDGNNGDHRNPKFDPCAFLLQLDDMDVKLLVDGHETTLHRFYIDNLVECDYPLSEEDYAQVRGLLHGESTTINLGAGGTFEVKCIEHHFSRKPHEIA